MKKLVCLTIAALALPALAAAQPDPDEALFNEKCSLCHPANRIDGYNAAKGWEPLVKRMQQNASGMISDDDAARILEYLKRKASK